MLKGLGRFMRREADQKRRDKELGYDVRLPARLPDPTNARARVPSAPPTESTPRTPRSPRRRSTPRSRARSAGSA